MPLGQTLTPYFSYHPFGTQVQCRLKSKTSAMMTHILKKRSDIDDQAPANTAVPPEHPMTPAEEDSMARWSLNTETAAGEVNYSSRVGKRSHKGNRRGNRSLPMRAQRTTITGKLRSVHLHKKRCPFRRSSCRQSLSRHPAFLWIPAKTAGMTTREVDTLW